MEKNMKILQINSVCGIGSTGRIALDIHDTLKNKGYESLIIYGRKKYERKNFIKIGSDLNLFFHYLQTRIFDNHGFASQISTLKVIKIIKKENPDLVHLHNLHGYYINVNLLFRYLKKINKPIVWTLHDCWSFTGHCSHFTYIKCEKWKNECEDCVQKKEYPKSLFLDQSKKNYYKKKKIFTSISNLTLVTPSQWLKKTLNDSFFKNFPIDVINNGIDLKIFKIKKENLKKHFNLNNKFIIMGVSSQWTEKKGFNLFLKLAENLEENERIILIGVAEKQKKELPSKIIGITKTNNMKELAEWYSIADIFYNPTLEDNFPTVNIEALALGIPILAYDIGGNREIVSEEVGIILNKPEDIRLGIDKIKDKGKKYYAANCRKRAENFYKKEEKCEEYINLYKKLIFLQKKEGI